MYISVEPHRKDSFPSLLMKGKIMTECVLYFQEERGFPADFFKESLLKYKVIVSLRYKQTCYTDGIIFSKLKFISQ